MAWPFQDAQLHYEALILPPQQLTIIVIYFVLQTGNGNTMTTVPPVGFNQTQFVTLPVTTATSTVRHKYFQCCGNTVHGRSCLERMIFSLMVILMVAVFLVAALLCLHIGSGGLKRLATLMFADQASKNDGNSGTDVIIGR